MYYRGFIIGIENDVCRLVSEKETSSSTEPIAEYVERNNLYLRLRTIHISLQIVGIH